MKSQKRLSIAEEKHEAWTSAMRIVHDLREFWNELAQYRPQDATIFSIKENFRDDYITTIFYGGERLEQTKEALLGIAENKKDWGKYTQQAKSVYESICAHAYSIVADLRDY